MKKPISTSRVPVGGNWTYVNPENGFVIKHPYLDECKRLAKEHRIANNFPIGLEFDDQFEDNVCQNAAAGTCADYTPPTLAEKLASVTKALFNAARRGLKTVTEAELLRRRSICQDCGFYGGSTKPLKVTCKKCGCSGLKLHLQTSVCPLTPPRW